MMQRLFLGVLTVIMFLAGYMSRAWTERGRPVQPPPASLANELINRDSSSTGRAALIAEIEKLRPQIEAYQAQVNEIYAEFDRQFAAILKPGQQEKHAANLKRFAEKEAKRKADVTPLSDTDIMRARERPMFDIYWMCTVTPRLKSLTKEYALDAEQQNVTRALLTSRQIKFVALLDGTPHPSIQLSRLAPIATERIQSDEGMDAGKAKAAAKDRK